MKKSIYKMSSAAVVIGALRVKGIAACSAFDVGDCIHIVSVLKAEYSFKIY